MLAMLPRVRLIDRTPEPDTEDQSQRTALSAAAAATVGTQQQATLIASVSKRKGRAGVDVSTVKKRRLAASQPDQSAEAIAAAANAAGLPLLPPLPASPPLDAAEEQERAAQSTPLAAEQQQQQEHQQQQQQQHIDQENAWHNTEAAAETAVAAAAAHYPHHHNHHRSSRGPLQQLLSPVYHLLRWRSAALFGGTGSQGGAAAGAAAAGEGAAHRAGSKAAQDGQQQEEDEQEEEEDGDDEDEFDDPLLFISRLPPEVPEGAARRGVALLPRRTRACSALKTLVLDLDETLVHSTLDGEDSEDEEDGEEEVEQQQQQQQQQQQHAAAGSSGEAAGSSGEAGSARAKGRAAVAAAAAKSSPSQQRRRRPPHDFEFGVLFNGATHRVRVRVRPHARAFLEAAAARFEVVVFTASQRVYAEKLLNILDPARRLIRHRIYRDACVVVNGGYVKDLSGLGRDLAHTAIVDNSPQAFGFQVDNGIPVESWYDDAADTELLGLIPLLEELAAADDVRPLLRARFRLKERVAEAAAAWRARVAADSRFVDGEEEDEHEHFSTPGHDE